MQELENIALPLQRRGRRETSNDCLDNRLKRLRSLSLLDGEDNTFFLKDDERPILVHDLPPSLEDLRMTMISPVKVPSGSGTYQLNRGSACSPVCVSALVAPTVRHAQQACLRPHILGHSACSCACHGSACLPAEKMSPLS